MQFLSEKINNTQLELLIDTQIFPQEIILKAAYNFLDRGYFFFSLNEDKNILLQCTKKNDNPEDIKQIIGDYSDSLLETYLRDKLEKDNKTIREIIVEKAINGPIDENNFVSLDTQAPQKNEINFDNDIDDILKEIENDPDLKIDENEIEKILKEIESETNNEDLKPTISIDMDAIAQAKKSFNK